MDNIATELKKFLNSYGIPERSSPSCVGKYRGQSIVICGDAACVWDDLERFGCRSENGVAKEGWHFFTVNGITSTFPGQIEHCYSNAVWVIRRYIRARRDDYKAEFGYPKFCHSRDEGADFIWPWNGNGTSGLGAVLCALFMGYERIVLAGMPLDNSPHNGEPPWRRTFFLKEVEKGEIHWPNAIKALNGKVKSLSGRTAQWLGAPSFE